MGKVNYLGIKINQTEPEWVNDFSLKLLEGFYLKEDENVNQALARASTAFCYGDYSLAQRIYDYAYNGWFMFSSPVLSNAPKGRWVHISTSKPWNKQFKWEGDSPKAMPISCFALEVPDTIEGQMDANKELSALSVAGGGVGLHNSIRAVTKKSPASIPYMKTVDAIIGYYRQSSTRRGAAAYYQDVSHPDIIEHINFRDPSKGDPARKSDNRTQFHNAVNITDDFIKAVLEDLDWDLKCPHSGVVYETTKARDLWEEILEVRALTGEPYLFKIDTANRFLPQTQKDKGLRVKGSNICIEVTLPTDEERTFVCCLSSANVEYYDEWKDTSMIADLTTFLDNILEYFIEHAEESLSKAVYSAKQERAIGIGTMGWHYYLQRNKIPFESGGFGSAIQTTHKIYSDIKNKAVEQSLLLGKKRGEAPDMEGTGRRNSNLLALAPNSNNAIILSTSPSIEPVSSNCYSHATRAGTFQVKNKYLELLLEEKGKNTESVWKQIVKDNGSVRELDFLSDQEKELFKTAFEIDQHWVIEQAEERAKYVCQSQSLNVFFSGGTDRAYFNSVHLKFLKAEHLKSLYYCRMNKETKADTVKEISRKALQDWNNEGEECVACSG